MSKIGKKNIIVPKESSIKIVGGNLTISGPKGKKTITMDIDMFDVNVLDNKKLSIKPKKTNETTKRLWGLNRSLLNNAIIGANVGFTKILELSGVGYRAAIKGSQLNLQLGFSHDVNFDIPEGIKISVEKQTTINISGFDKQKVGEITSTIKSIRPPEPYKGKGIKEKGQYILRKEGKKK